ncbi:hypothetical protein [Streptomyces celluloflavus]|uniref:hypothetical protein n=1 Tax=Streptomyces celluloflavus TaxID=58344 RepID=UPI0036A68160
MPAVTFVDELPAAKTRNSENFVWAMEVSTTLRQRPGQWAIVERGRQSSARASRIKGRLVLFRPAGSFEATTRTVDGEMRCYARYVGEVGGKGEARQPLS